MRPPGRHHLGEKLKRVGKRGASLLFFCVFGYFFRKKDLVEFPKTVLDFMEIIPVKNVDEVLKIALTKPLKRVEWVDVDQISKKEK